MGTGVILKLFFTSAGLNAFGLGLGFFTQILLARLMSVEHYGLYNFYFSSNVLLTTIAVLGLPYAAMKLIPGFVERGDIRQLRYFIKFSVVTSLCLGLILGCGLYGYFYWAEIPHKISWVLAVLGVVTLLPIVGQKMLSGILNGLQRPADAIVTDTTGREALLIISLGAMFFAGFSLDVFSALSVLLLVTILVNLYAAFKVKSNLQATDKTEHALYDYKSWLQLALPMMFVISAQVVMARTDLFMIGLLKGAYETGLYAAASKLAQASSVGVMALGFVFPARYAALHQQNKRKERNKLYMKTQLFMLSTTCAASVVLYALSDLILLLFGEEYLEASQVLIVMLLGFSLNSLWGPASHSMLMIGKEKLTMWTTLATLVANVLLNIIFIHLYGYIGAAIATALTLNARNIFYVFILYRFKKQEVNL